MKELWRQSSFRWYWVGLFLSGLGNQFGWLALTWFVMNKTGSSAAMGGVVLAYNIPAVLAGLVAGVLLDRFDRRQLIMLDNVLRGLIFFTLVLLLQMEGTPLWLVYVLIVIAGMLSPLSSAGAQTLLPRLVTDKSLLVKANGLMESQWQINYLFGPAAAGVLIAWIGAANVLIVDAIGFFLCAFCFSRLKPASGVDSFSVERMDEKEAEEIQGKAAESSGSVVAFGPFLRSLIADIRTGYCYLLGRRRLLWLVLFTFFFNMAYGPVEVGLPLYANNDLEGGAVSLGLLWSALAAGALLGSILFSAVTWKLPTGVTLAAIIGLWGITTLPLALFTRVEVAMLAMALAGLSFSPYNILYRSHLQKHVPEELLGRVLTSVRTITGTGMPAGAAAAGWLIPVCGVQGMFGAASVVCVVTGLLAYVALRRLDEPELLPVQQGGEEALHAMGQHRVEQ
ncbi:MFS family permease [Brevibacillus aydinogluensis]|uniref:MFS transporter n=1 Tax=Brevibacillus aydinogluensis TaxID=927786 RepID=UPI002892CF96|nr:MFS transporter [Brevibacillus aydinogluensis]MDT3416910.1 MFS family permease [Brevibacillus aydinogluensis]